MVSVRVVGRNENAVVDTGRTPLTDHGGVLSESYPGEPVVRVLEAPGERTEANPDEWRDFLPDRANQEDEQGRDLARRFLLAGEFLEAIRDATPARLYGSSSIVVNDAARTVEAGGDVVSVVGLERGACRSRTGSPIGFANGTTRTRSPGDRRPRRSRGATTAPARSRVGSRFARTGARSRPRRGGSTTGAAGRTTTSTGAHTGLSTTFRSAGVTITPGNGSRPLRRELGRAGHVAGVRLPESALPGPDRIPNEKPDVDLDHPLGRSGVSRREPFPRDGATWRDAGTRHDVRRGWPRSHLDFRTALKRARS